MTKIKADSDENKYLHSRFPTPPPKEWLKTRDKFMSGFCNPYQPAASQAHEGDSVNRRTCDFWDSCPCYCHYQIDQMFEMIGEERQPAEQSPEYRAKLDALHRQTQQMLDALPAYSRITGALSMPGDPMAHPDNEGPYTGQVDGMTGTPKPVFAPTPTGRRARGQLEYDVLEICIKFTENVFDWTDCTPKLVAEEIGKMNAVEPPSTGAINAVWDRWEKMNFAEQAKKPSRFVRFTLDEPVNALALERLKARKKREVRRGQAEQKRGTIRPKRR